MPSRNSAITKGEYETLAAFRYALRLFLGFSEQAAKQAGLTPQQHQALLAIKGFPKRDRVTVGELAERLQLHHHSAVGLADRLASAKFIARGRDKKDLRQVYLALTGRGEAVLQKLSAAHRKQLRQIGPEIQNILQRLRGVIARGC